MLVEKIVAQIQNRIAKHQMAMSRHQEAAAASKKKQIEIEEVRSNKIKSSEPNPPPKVLASKPQSERGQHNNDDSKKVERARRGDDHLKHRQVFEKKPTPNETMEQERLATPVKVPLIKEKRISAQLRFSNQKKRLEEHNKAMRDARLENAQRLEDLHMAQSASLEVMRMAKQQDIKKKQKQRLAKLARFASLTCTSIPVSLTRTTPTYDSRVLVSLVLYCILHIAYCPQGRGV